MPGAPRDQSTEKVQSLRHKCLDIFKAGVSAVNPYKAVSRSVKISTCGKHIIFDQKRFKLNGRNVYACSFGKAGYEMFRAIDEILPNNLSRSILSLPIGQKGQHECKWRSPNVDMYFGAANNIADRDSLRAAAEIFNMAKGLGKDDLLIALISGGGSALLPLPADGINLEDKQIVTNLMGKHAASIQELNTVRKALSKIKGGGLLKAAYPCKVISLILSDIIGDPIDFIASGPTVLDRSPPNAAYNIIQKYKLEDSLPSNVVQCLKNRIPDKRPSAENHVKIVGNNRIALRAAADYAKSIGFQPVILTDSLSGEARQRAAQLSNLIKSLEGKKSKSDVERYLNDLMITREHADSTLADRLMEGTTNHLCLLLGGETTVTVKGSGTGGRSQEFALAASINLYELGSTGLELLACGTDGIDGPTDAAGAYADATIVSSLEEARSYLNNNDSYNFHKASGSLVFTGHTGTNVMDMVVVLWA